MEAAHFSETSANFRLTVWHHMSEDSNFENFACISQFPKSGGYYTHHRFLISSS
jgi:hypothetical protein